MNATGLQPIAPAAAIGDDAPNAADLLERLIALIERYVVLPEQYALDLLALYVLHTWAFGASDATPYLVIVSAEKQSGKTRLLEVLAALVRRPWHTASASAAAL